MRKYLRHVGTGAAGAGLTVLCLVTAVAMIIALAACLVVVGWVVVRPATALLRGVARLSRRWAGARLGRKVKGVAPRAEERTLAGRAQEIVTDSTMWRELAWMLCHIPLGFLEAVTFLLPWVGAGVSYLDARICAGLLGYSTRQRVPSDGVGTAPPPRGYGLTGMRERVEALGGTLLVGPTPQGGFAVRATIPLPSPQQGPQAESEL